MDSITDHSCSGFSSPDVLYAFEVFSYFWVLGYACKIYTLGNVPGSSLSCVTAAL